VGDFFAFRRMIAPVLIHIIYWVASLALLALGVLMLINKMDLVWDLFPKDSVKDTTHALGFLRSTWEALGDGTTRMLLGIAVAIGGPFFVRLYCELLMLPFRVNDTLTDIRNMQKAQHVGTVAVAPRR
jgi:hypothetical protein